MRSVRLAPSYVLLELAQPPRLRDLLPNVLGAPKLEHRIRDPMPPRPLHDFGPGVGRLQNRDDLFLAEPSLLHVHALLHPGKH